MAFRGDQHTASTVIATRYSLIRPERRSGGRLHIPSARDLLSQHSLTWDERSSPGELIHPGDLASLASITSSDGELDFAIAVMAIRKKRPETGAGAIHSIGTMAA